MRYREEDLTEEELKEYPKIYGQVGFEKGANAISFISALKHTKGEWAGMEWQWIPWQRNLIWKLFGTVDENGYRQYKKAFVELPKKMGKTEAAAAIALFLLIADDEYGAEVYSAACDRIQAGLVFNCAASMIRQEPRLEEKLKILDSTKRIIYYETNSFYHVLSSEVYSKHGYNIHGCIFDELHAQQTRDLYDVLSDGAGDARRQPLMFMITTAGVKDINSIGWEVHEYARQVQEGIIPDEHFLPVIYSLSPDEDWTDKENWKKVNPSLGYTITIDKLEAAFQEAQHVVAKQNTFRRLRLDQWTSQESRWMDVGLWNECSKSVDMEALKGRVCYGGLDLASNLDIAALVWVFPSDDGYYDIVPFFWIPEEAMIQRSRRDQVPYDVWVQEKYIRATPGNATDYGVIRKDINDFRENYNIQEIAFDPWGATEMSQNLTKDGYIVIQVAQNMKNMSPPTKDLQRLILEKKIRHGGNPVLKWMFDNLVVYTDANENIKFMKNKSTERIDGMVALVMGLDRAIRQEKGTSVYEDRGILILGEEEVGEENREEND